MTAMTESEKRAAEVLAEHSLAGAQAGRQGAGQTIPEDLVLCWSCGWMRMSEYAAHIAAALSAAGCLCGDREGETVTEVCSCGYGGFHEELNKRCALYVTPDESGAEVEMNTCLHDQCECRHIQASPSETHCDCYYDEREACCCCSALPVTPNGGA